MTTETDNYDDLEELADDISDDSDSTLSDEFQQAVTYVQLIAHTLDNADLLVLYGFYKQGIIGPCTDSNAPRPSWYDFRGKSKYEAWKAVGNMDRSRAQHEYVEKVKSLAVDFSLEMTKSAEESGVTQGKSHWGGVMHSTIQPNDEEKDDTSKSGSSSNKIFDCITDDNLLALKELLSLNPQSISTLSSDGDQLTLLHWAADRGANTVLAYLLSLQDARIDINAQDSDGQTALHYAASCGHLQCCRLLVEAGASKDARDKDGNSCVDMATEDSVSEFFKATL